MFDSPIGIGIVASRAMRSGSQPTIVALARTFEPLFTEVLKARIVAVGGTFDALRLHGVFSEYPPVERLPEGYLGGLVRLVGRVVDSDPGRTVDMVIYLSDPTDPTSLYPEALALERQCVVHGKPFFCSFASAAEWLTLKWAQAQKRNPVPAHAGRLAALIAAHVRPTEIGRETVALIAHDAHKHALMQFASRHHPLLSSFGRRIATGTTGTLLNGEKPRRSPSGFGGELPSAVFRVLSHRLGRLARDHGAAPWVETRRSGPLGGDAEIAAEVLDGHCRRVVFFEDPHVAREHEADIQLLERAARVPGVNCLCLHSAPTAEAWARGLEELIGLPGAGQELLAGSA